MTGDQSGRLLFYALLLLLPLSALLPRRIALGSVLRNLVAWVVIFGVGLVIVGQRDRLAPFWTGARDALVGRDQTLSGKTVRIHMALDGHFWADVTLNGVRRRMLIDSGATFTALSARTALAAGVGTNEGTPVFIETANGTVAAKRANAKRLELDTITAANLPVIVSPEFGDTDVLGMNFLSRLRSWRVDGRMLILQPEFQD